jgi:hypothetical protein
MPSSKRFPRVIVRRMNLLRRCAAVALAAAVGCSVHHGAHTIPRPAVIPHAQWETQRPLGHAADATRRNKRAGDSLTFRDLAVVVLGTSVDSSGGATADVARLRLSLGDATEMRTAREGSAFNWKGFHVAVVAIYGPGELGAGLVALEVATVASLPPHIAASDSAGGASMRLRIPHRITHVTLHHTGDARTLEPNEDPAVRLRNLQAWGARDRNWWDLPYHFLMGLDGRVYEGRDHHFMGETNTTYNPEGHFLISIIGNYERQEPTPAQIESIANLMAWAIAEYDLALDRIGGHYHYAQTGCPGKHLRKYLEDGTLKRMVAERLERH